MRLSTSEHSRTVYAGEYRSFAPDGTNVFKSTTVGTNALVEYFCTYLFFGKVIYAVFYFANVVGVNFGKVL